MNRLWAQWDEHAGALDLPMYGALRPRPRGDGTGNGAVRAKEVEA
jgi:hypothetical protein